MKTVGKYEMNSINTGDVLDFLSGFDDGTVPLFLFSPPYNLGISSGGGLSRMKHNGKSKGKWNNCTLVDGYDGQSDDMDPEEYKRWQFRILNMCWSKLENNGAIYYNHKPRIQYGQLTTPLDYNPGLPVRQIVIWARAGGINFNPTAYCNTHEWIVIFAKPEFRLKSKGASGVGDVWYIPQSPSWHPAPFPITLAERVLETVEPAFVVDPFSGSGTTAKAAKKMGVGYVCGEKSEKYVKKSTEELEK